MTISYSIEDGRGRWLDRYIPSRECAVDAAQRHADRLEVPVYVVSVNRGGCRTGLPLTVEPRRREPRRRAR